MNNSPTDPGPCSGEIPESDPRVQLAAERTMLAWVRSGLALMAFGFVVARFALIVRTLGMDCSPYLTLEATVIGVMMIALGVVATIGAPWHYRSYFRRIRQGTRRSFAATSLTMFVACATAAIGVVLAVYLVFVDLAKAPLSPKATSKPPVTETLSTRDESDGPPTPAPARSQNPDRQASPK